MNLTKELAELRNEDFNEYPDEVGHVCESCEEENIEGDMLEYEGSWWCRDCCPELKRCDYCGSVAERKSDELCPECGRRPE